MNDFQVINLKEFNQTEFQAIKELEIFIDLCKKADVKAIKIIHGYGSHGRGGAIQKAVLNFARSQLKLKKIKMFLLGNEWTIASEKALKVIYAAKSCYNDEDLNKLNPGITIILL